MGRLLARLEPSAARCPPPGSRSRRRGAGRRDERGVEPAEVALDEPVGGADRAAPRHAEGARLQGEDVRRARRQRLPHRDRRGHPAVEVAAPADRRPAPARPRHARGRQQRRPQLVLGSPCPESMVVSAVSTSTATQCSSAPLRSTFSSPAASSPAARSRICSTSITGLRRITFIGLTKDREASGPQYAAALRPAAPARNAAPLIAPVRAPTTRSKHAVSPTARAPRSSPRRRPPACRRPRARAPRGVASSPRARPRSGAVALAQHRGHGMRSAKASPGDRSGGASALPQDCADSAVRARTPARLRHGRASARPNVTTNLVVPVPLDVVRAMARENILREREGARVTRRSSAFAWPRGRRVSSAWTSLRVLGWSDDQIARRSQAARAETAVWRGVYAVGHEALTFRGRAIAALLAVGDDAALSHATVAVDLRSPPPDPAAVHRRHDDRPPTAEPRRAADPPKATSRPPGTRAC